MLYVIHLDSQKIAKNQFISLIRGDHTTNP
jgi:hypothetical protein